MEIEEKVKQALIDHGITEPIKNVIVKDPGLQGEGFVSQSRYITVQFESPDVPDMNLFAKIGTSNNSHNQMVDDMKAFEKESVFLTKYVPAADDMCRRKGCEGASVLFPKCYFGDSKLVLLQNLVLDGGYSLLDKTLRGNLDEAKFALKTLAKHHAISYVMIQEEGGPANFFQRFPDLDYECFDKPVFRVMMGDMLEKSLESNLGILENFDVEGRDEAISILKPFLKKDLLNLMIEPLNHDDDEFLVLCHGDYWGNNMMFIKDEENRVRGHKAIDLQLTRYNSPALDIVYFLYISVQSNVRINHLEELLRLYLDTLKATSNDLGYQIPLSYEQLYKSVCSKLHFGFWFGICTVLGLGVQAMKDFDVNTVDVKDWSRVMHELLQKWIANNPQHSESIAKEVVQVALELKRLSS